MTRLSGILAIALAGMALPAVAADTARDASETKSGIFKPGQHAVHMHPAPTSAADAGPPPLYEGIGDMTMPISTEVPEAQAYFDQGLALAFAFNHGEARRSFIEAQRLDPECAMCFWGEAYVLGGNINDPMRPENAAPAEAAAKRAVALSEGVTAKEKALIEAIAKRYGEGDRSELESAYAEAMQEAAANHGDDPLVLSIAAESLMNLQPWDYWEADGTTPKGRTEEIIALLEKALAIDPDNPAAIHFYIHAVEASANPERAEPYADRLRGQTPALGHLVHMPAHIYMRVGRYADVIETNRKAAAADEMLLAQMGEAASPIYRYGYYPHNVHFLLVGAQNAGLAEDALAAAGKLDGILSEDVMKELGWIQAIRTAPYSVHAIFSDPAKILALPAPTEDLPFVHGFWHYARGIAHARAGNLDAARAEAKAIAAIEQSEDLETLEEQYVPARTILRVAREVLQARVADAEGDLAAAEAHLRTAASLEDELPYMEPPYWYYPVRQTLGAVLLKAGRAEEAVEAFKSAVSKYPGNAWSLYGLAEALEAKGDAAGAAEANAAFEKAWLGDPAGPDLSRL